MGDLVRGAPHTWGIPHRAKRFEFLPLLDYQTRQFGYARRFSPSIADLPGL